MEDKKIVDLYWLRSESAISETKTKYGKYCHTIAHNILCNIEDSEECVNDTYLRAWNSMPQHRPSVLKTFLGKITRNLALNRYKTLSANKRNYGQVPLALDELQECIPERIIPQILWMIWLWLRFLIVFSHPCLRSNGKSLCAVIGI